MGRLKALGASDVPTPSRVQPTRPRTSSVRYDPSEISAAPRQAHLPHKSRVEPGSQPKRRPQSQPKPKPAARKTVKGRVGLTDDATSTARGGNVTLRAKVLAAVLRLSRERRKGKEGVGHSSVNLYLAQHAPEGTAPDSSSFAARILKTKQELIGEGVIAPGESKGRTLAVVPEVVKSVKQLCDVSVCPLRRRLSVEERLLTAILVARRTRTRVTTSAPALRSSPAAAPTASPRRPRRPSRLAGPPARASRRSASTPLPRHHQRARPPRPRARNAARPRAPPRT
ncbi:hypothetical protein DMC30DRAFT_22420 [Rhodotorula diobovata]|uniref:Uncharacterized protein n=1 Tax=Rhodotorula diobovata TaxID=5288 RepID=A0A5C5G522_9BASI|nr:hypothetical protein DMC30DRAFT_22420 [Rhodotorula diobovata]